MKKLTSRQQQAVETKNRIFQTAMSLFEEHGFNNVTLKQICDACNISTGAFYHYFSDKDDILIEQYKFTDSTFYSDISSLAGDNYVDKIIDYLCKFVGAAEMYGVEAVTEICHAWLSRRLGFPYGDNSAVARGLTQLLNSACKAGEIPAHLNTRFFGLDILMLVRGIIYHWCLMHGTFSASDKARVTLRAYLSGRVSGNYL